MGKNKREAAAAAKASKSKIRILQAVLAVVIVGAIYTAYLVTQSGKTEQGSGELVPREQLPATLDPARFDDQEIRRAYQAAKDAPEALAAVKCYCGCISSAGHRSNLDCFTDQHGAG